MQIFHAKSLTQADATGTATIWNGSSTSTVVATDLQRPSDWNSAHTYGFSVTGNTTGGSSTFTGTNLLWNAAGGISMGFSNGSVYVSGPSGAGAASLSTWVPYFPASTSSQTMGAMGTSTASALVFPVILDDPVVFNAIRLLQSGSYVTSTVSGRQTISSQFGIFSLNGSTLSMISSGSFSIAATVSSVSATFNIPGSTNSAGYTTASFSITGTAQGQSLIGTAGSRVVDMVFGGNMTLNPGIYWIGLHQRQSSSSANVGISTAMIGNAMNATSGVGPLGSSTSAFFSNPSYHLGGHGFYTSTGSAGYSGTALPGSIIQTALSNNLNVMPMVTFLST